MIDDVGKEVPLLRRNGFSEWPLKGDPRIQLLLSRLSWNYTESGGTHSLNWWQTLICLGIAVGLYKVTGKIASSGFAVVVAGMMLRRMPIRASLYVSNEDEAKKLSGLLLEEGLCPSCGYNFDGLPFDKQKITYCPECAAGWQSKKILWSASFHDAANRAAKFGYPTVRPGQLNYSLQDARGRKTFRIDLARHYIRIPSNYSAAHTLRISKAWKQAKKESQWKRTSILVIVGFFAFLMGVGMVYGIWNRSDEVWYFMVPFVILVIVMGVVWWGGSGYSEPAVKEAFFADELCPACGQDLTLAKVLEDFEHACVRCHSIWRFVKRK